MFGPHVVLIKASETKKFVKFGRAIPELFAIRFTVTFMVNLIRGHWKSNLIDVFYSQQYFPTALHTNCVYHATFRP